MKPQFNITRQLLIMGRRVLPKTIEVRLEKDWSDYLSFKFIFPQIDNEGTYNPYTEEPREQHLEVNFGTGFAFIKDEAICGVEIKILGFGISLTSQTGY